MLFGEVPGILAVSSYAAGSGERRQDMNITYLTVCVPQVSSAPHFYSLVHPGFRSGFQSPPSLPIPVKTRPQVGAELHLELFLRCPGRDLKLAINALCLIT